MAWTRLLDVDVDPFAGPGAFVAGNGLAGGPIQYGKNGQAVTVQDPVSGGGGDAGDGLPAAAGRCDVHAPDGCPFLPRWAMSRSGSRPST